MSVLAGQREWPEVEQLRARRDRPPRGYQHGHGTRSGSSRGQGSTPSHVPLLGRTVSVRASTVMLPVEGLP